MSDICPCQSHPPAKRSLIKTFGDTCGSPSNNKLEQRVVFPTPGYTVFLFLQEISLGFCFAWGGEKKEKVEYRQTFQFGSDGRTPPPPGLNKSSVRPFTFNPRPYEWRWALCEIFLVYFRTEDTFYSRANWSNNNVKLSLKSSLTNFKRLSTYKKTFLDENPSKMEVQRVSRVKQNRW